MHKTKSLKKWQIPINFLNFRVAFKAKNGLKRTQYWVGILLIYPVNHLEAISKLTLAIFGIPSLFSISFSKYVIEKKILPCWDLNALALPVTHPSTDEAQCCLTFKTCGEEERRRRIIGV